MHPRRICGDVSQAELDRYLVAMEGIMDAGFDAEKELGLDPSNAQTMAVGTQYTEKIESLLGAQGFDQQSFMDVHQNVIYAYAADMMVDAQKELEQDRARQEAAMAQLEQQMSPEQAKAVMDAMANAGAMMQSTYANVPEANKALVAKNKARIEAMFEKARQRGEASR